MKLFIYLVQYTRFGLAALQVLGTLINNNIEHLYSTFNKYSIYIIYVNNTLKISNPVRLAGLIIPILKMGAER